MKPTRSYKEIDAKKKAMGISFRRYLSWKGAGDQVTPYLGTDIAGVREWIQDNWLPFAISKPRQKNQHNSIYPNNI